MNSDVFLHLCGGVLAMLGLWILYRVQRKRGSGMQSRRALRVLVLGCALAQCVTITDGAPKIIEFSLTDEVNFWSPSAIMTDSFASFDGRLVRVIVAQQTFIGGPKVTCLMAFDVSNQAIIQKMFYVNIDVVPRIAKTEGTIEIWHDQERLMVVEKLAESTRTATGLGGDSWLAKRR